MAEDDAGDGTESSVLTDDHPPTSAVRRLAGSSTGNARAAVISQGIQAAASLGLQLLVLSRLGNAGLGRFSLLVAGVLVTFTAVHTGWIGDALPVFDRTHPPMRRALAISQWVSGALALVVGFTSAVLLADRPATSAALFAVTLLAWTVEETGRRLFMARLEFWGLVRNDVVYLAAAGLTTAIAIVANRVTIDTMLVAMLVGASASIVDGRRQLPAAEFDMSVRGPNDLRALANFSVWRAGQIGVRPLSMTAVRVLIKSTTSAAGLGMFESGRLILAPIFTAANGIGSFLLPTFARKVDDDRETMRMVIKVAVGGMLVTALYGTTAALGAPFLNSRFDSANFSSRLIFAWTIYAMAYFANIPFANALVARHRSKDVFRARCIDGVVGVALGYGLVSVSGVAAVPIGLALGVIGGSGWLWIWLARSGVMVDAVSGPRPLLRNAARPQPMSIPFARQWVAAIPVLLIVATEYKWRTRELADSLSGSADIAILLEIGIYAAIAAYLLAFIASPPGKRRPTAVSFMTGAYGITLATTAIYAPFPQLAVVRGFQLLVMVGFAQAVTTRATRRQMHQLAHTYVALITMSAILGIFWRIPYSRLQLDRFNWMNVHPVIAAAMLAISVVLCVAYLVRNVGRRETMLWPRGAYAIALTICTVALIATKTRGSMAGAAFGVLVVVTMSIRRSDRLPAVALGAMGASVIALVFGPSLLEFLTRGETTEELTSLSNRTTLWSLAYRLFLERPFSGWGLTASRGLFFDEVGLGGAHSAIVNVAVDGGIVVTAFWVGLIVAILAALRRVWRSNAEVDSILVMGIMATMLMNGLTTEGMGSGNGVSALWLLICAAWVGVLQRRSSDVHRRHVIITSLPENGAFPDSVDGDTGVPALSAPEPFAGELEPARRRSLTSGSAEILRALPSGEASGPS